MDRVKVTEEEKSELKEIVKKSSGRTNDSVIF